MADPKEKNTISYQLEGQEDDGVMKNLFCEALVKLQ